MTSTSALDASLRYLAAGFSVIPVKSDGSKAPALAEWAHLHAGRAAEAQVRAWHAAGSAGVGIVTDAGSGNLAVFDFEFLDFYEEWAAAVEAELPGLLAGLPKVRTPGKDEAGGRHVYARCEALYSGRKLARISAEEALARTGDAGKRTAVEIKGKGGQVLAPGCPPECHPSGRTYDLLPGPAIERTPTLTREQMAALVRAAIRLDRAAAKPAAERKEAAAGTAKASGGEKPGEDFNARATWAEILEPHGWAVHQTVNGVTHWTRPGKDEGTSATTGHCSGKVGGDLLYVFSTNADPLEAEKTYSKFGAYAELVHGGDHSKAASELARVGYGSPPEEVDPGEPEELPAEAEGAKEQTPPWPAGVFPRVIEDYAAALARSLACPIDLVGAAILTTAGAAVGASRAVGVTRRWVESPRLYMALVADPGGGKSPAVDQVTEPFARRQTAAHAHWLAAKMEYDLAAEVYEQERKVYARRLAEAKDDDAREKVGAQPVAPARPPYPHCYTSDATTEALVPMLSENPRGFLMLKDELSGWIAGMNQYKAGGKGADRQFWLSAWSGASLKADRKSSRDQGPLIVERPFMAVLGGIQPDMLSSLSDERGREDGFVHRILFVYPDELPWSGAICESPAEGLESAWDAALDHLFSLEMEVDAEGVPCAPKVLGFEPEARRAAEGWYAAHARERDAEDFPQALVGPWSKMRSHFFRIALAVHLLRAACGEAAADSDLDADSVLRAMSLTDYFKGQLRKVYARLGCTQEDRKAARLVEWIRRHGGRVTARDVARSNIVKRSSEAEKALADLVDLQFGRMEKQTQTGRGRRKPDVFVLNGCGPRILAEDDEPAAGNSVAICVE